MFPDVTFGAIVMLITTIPYLYVRHNNKNVHLITRSVIYQYTIGNPRDIHVHKKVLLHCIHVCIQKGHPLLVKKYLWLVNHQYIMYTLTYTLCTYVL